MRTARILLLAAIVLTPLSAIIVDRVAVTAGTKVITESEIIRRIRLTAFQNGEAPDFGVASRREAAQRLIDQKLVEREMDLGNYVRVPAELSKQLLTEFTMEHFSADASALRLALAAIDLTPADMEAELASQADLLSFLSLRFRPAVQVAEEDIEKYFREHIDSNAVVNPKALNEVRGGIEQILANERADKDLDVWLKEQRDRTRIRYLVRELQ